MIAHNTISSLIPEAQGGEETVDKNIPEENNSNANEEDNINNEPNVPLTESQNDELKKIAIAHGEGEEGWSDENDYEQPATPEAAGAVGEDGVPTADEPGGIQGMDLPTIESLSVPQQMCLDRAKKYAMEQSIRQVLINQELQTKEYTQSQSHAKIMKQQALVYMCRVYIGSVYYEVREEQLRRSFGPFGPIKLCNMSLDPLTGKHKGFAFLEFEMPEASQLAIEQMNGVLLGGRAIKIGRPTNMPQSMPIVEQLVRDSQKSNRIYVSSIHADLSLDDVKSVFGAFGAIVSVQLRPCAITGNHAGYGFIEFETVQAANDAVQSMNLFDLGGQFLRVGKALSPPEEDLMDNDAFKNPEELYVKKIEQSHDIGGITPQIAVVAAKVTTQLIQRETIAKKEEYKKEEAVKAELMKPKREGSKFGGKVENIQAPCTVVPSITVDQLHNPGQDETKVDPNSIEAECMQASGRTVENRSKAKSSIVQNRNQSKIVCCRNMITAEEIDDEFEDEIKEECEEKYGKVTDVIVYQEKQSEETDAEIIVKVFIEFEDQTGADKAKKSLHGRWFGGQQITAHYYNAGFYEVNDLSH